MSSESLGTAAGMSTDWAAPSPVATARRMAGSRPAIRVVDVCNVDSSANSILKHRMLAMRALGLDNRVLCVDGPYVKVLEDAGIPVGIVPMPRGFDLLQVARCFIAVYRYFKREKIDLVHTHFSVPGFIGRLAAWCAGVPVIVHTIHGYPYHARSSKTQRWFYILLERAVGRIAQIVLSQNRGDMQDAIRYSIVPRERLRFIGNGICLERFRPPRRRPVPAVATIVCVARMEYVKNHDMLFQALKRLGERGLAWRLQLIGGGELKPEYQALCERLGIADRVEFLGYRDDIPELLARADVSVLTSIKEGVPRAILESMAMGLPVVATRIPGNVDAVRDGETGFLVEVDDVEALAESLGRLIADPGLRARLGARGREIVLQEFDENRIIDALSHIYRSLLLKKGIVGPVPVPQTVSS
jgi:glycosyltransferase involved in cell wall biosynthesis